ncbi:hypothetical protein ACP4OV_005056 [Aristida adscensionis]
MAPKSLVLAALLLLLLVAAAGKGAEADTSAGAGATASTSVLIAGKVPCAVGTSINVLTVPVFPNAAVQLQCGGQVVAGATSDSTGAFLISMTSVPPTMLAALLTGKQCNLVVNTPLGACNQALAGAAGTLTAPLKLLGASTGTGSGSDPLGGLIGLIGQIIGGLIGGIVNLAPASFSVA